MVEEMPEYMSGHDLLFLGPIKNGKAEVVDISVLTPNTYLTAPIQAALRAYQSEGKVSDEVYKQVAAATFAATKELVSPFIEPFYAYPTYCRIVFLAELQQGVNCTERMKRLIRGRETKL
jgi:hypothetical protein